MLLKDGVKYDLWTPPSEDAFEHVVKEHTQEIFGEQSIYLDIKPYLKSVAGLGSMPDGLTIIYGKNPQWHIIEAELSNHSVHEHIVPQVARFTAGIKNPTSQRKVVDVIYSEILKDELLCLRLRKAISSIEIHKFISDLISNQPILTIIIDKEIPELEDVKTTLAHLRIKIVEFQTFTRAGVGLPVHAHLFEPLYEPVSELRMEGLISPNQVEISVRNLSNIKWHYFEFDKKDRHFLPGFKIPFTLEADGRELQTAVVGAKEGTSDGDPNAGYYIQRNLGEWIKRHPEIKVGDKLCLTVIEPMKRYRLELVK